MHSRTYSSLKVNTIRLSRSWWLLKGTTSSSRELLFTKSRWRGRLFLKLASSKNSHLRTFQNPKHAIYGFIAHQLVVKFLVACVEQNAHNLKHHFQFSSLVCLLDLLEDSEQTGE